MVEFQTFQNNFSCIFVDPNYMFGCEFNNSEVSGVDARANVLQTTVGFYMETTIGQMSGECDLFQIVVECFVVKGCCYLSESYV